LKKRWLVFVVDVTMADDRWPMAERSLDSSGHRWLATISPSAIGHRPTAIEIR
jgi:hypothetical protein